MEVAVTVLWPMSPAKKYVAQWATMHRESVGLLIWGEVGTGKTFLAGCIANALLETGITVLMTNFSRILNAMTGSYGVDRNAYVDDLNRYELLIIDDLGIERDTDFALEQVFSVIDSRYQVRKPLIVTTNLKPSQMKQRSRWPDGGSTTGCWSAACRCRSTTATFAVKRKRRRIICVRPGSF